MKGKRYSMVLRTVHGDEREFDVAFLRSGSSHDCFAAPVIDDADRARWIRADVVRMSRGITGRVVAGPDGLPRVLLDHSLTRYRRNA